MTRWSDRPIRTAADVAAFENEMPLQARLTERSVYDVFDGGSQRAPDAVALTMLMTGEDDEQPRRVTYAQLARLVRQAANAFHAMTGPRPGVAYLLPSLIETHAVLWGAQTCGYAVPLNFLLQPTHLADLVRAADARVLVALGPHPVLDIWEKALAVRNQVPGLELVAVNLPGAGLAPEVLDLAAVLASQPDDRLVFGAPGCDDEVAAYLHTGGTTGDPKLVTLTHRSQLVAAMGGALLGDMNPGDVLSATLPLFHAGGTVFCALSPLMAGAELLIMSPAALRNPAMVTGFWRLCARYGVTMAGAVPTGLAAVIEVPVGDADLSKLRIGFSGASSIPGSVEDRFETMAGVRLAQVYGMTESSGLLSIDPVAGPGARGSVGVSLPYLEVKVLRQEADGLGGECDPGEIGQVVATGAPVSPGYRNRAHDASTLRDGMLNTGDLGFRDQDGNLYIAGRAKDLIIRSGHNIDPLMIEDAMSGHPAVAMAAAVGQPDGYAGEIPVVYVSLGPDAQVSIDELHEHARRTIAERPAWPRHIYVLNAIPMTAVGKIFKPDLRCDAARRVLEPLLTERLDATPDVVVHTGGPRGLRVEVTLREGSSLEDQAQARRLLDPFLFEGIVHIADPAGASAGAAP
jgi:fatty-acyl-CoA synthase